jgi:hypothetical protein
MPKDNAQWVRYIKLAAVGVILALGFATAAYLLNGPSREVALSAAVSLTFFALASLWNGYLRRKPLDTSRAAIDAKARKQRLAAILGLPCLLVLAPIVSTFVDRLSLGWIVCGFSIGAFIFIALFFSPLFVAAIASPTRSASPLSRMTSMERAQRQRYE